MKCLATAGVIIASLAPTASVSAFSTGDCAGRIPDYIALGAKDMVLTQDAERILCRDDTQLEVWNGEVGPLEPFIVENKDVPSAVLLTALRAGKPLEFRRCVFNEELLLQGRIGAGLSFRECEFRGRLDIRNATIRGPFEIRSSILHYGLSVFEVHAAEAVVIDGSVLASPLELERSRFEAGLVISGSRLAAGVVANGVRSPLGISFNGVRFLGSVHFTETEVAGSVRFTECEWSRGSLMAFARGTIGGGIRFDSCGFEADWKGEPKEGDQTLIRLSDLTLGAPFILPSATTSNFPRVRMSRCVVPALMIPEWRIGRDMVLLTPEERGRGLRAAEEQGEVLQLLQKSYEMQGRTRDSFSVQESQRRVRAELKGGPTLWIRIAAEWFGTGIWWFFGLVSAFAIVIAVQAVAWGLSAETESLATRLYRALDLSFRAFFAGPPKDASMVAGAVWFLRMEHSVGMGFFFLWGILVNEWIKG